MNYKTEIREIREDQDSTSESAQSSLKSAIEDLESVSHWAIDYGPRQLKEFAPNAQAERELREAVNNATEAAQAVKVALARLDYVRSRALTEYASQLEELNKEGVL